MYASWFCVFHGLGSLAEPNDRLSSFNIGDGIKAEGNSIAEKRKADKLLKDEIRKDDDPENQRALAIDQKRIHEALC